jgi:hypothetical protein
MNILSGDGWTLEYKLKGGKLAGMKFHGKAKNMKTAMQSLERELSNNA